MIKVKNYSQSKESFEHMLKKFRNRTIDTIKEVEQRAVFEKPCVENERVRRRWYKEKKKHKVLKKRYGPNWRWHNDVAGYV